MAYFLRVGLGMLFTSGWLFLGAVVIIHVESTNLQATVEKTAQNWTV